VAHYLLTFLLLLGAVRAAILMGQAAALVVLAAAGLGVLFTRLGLL
jgi:hypothetical protein